MNRPPEDLPTIQSVLRAVDVLFAFDPDTLTLSPAEISNRLGMNRTTAWRYLVTLAETGLLRVSDGDPGRFALGSRVLGLSELFLRQWGDLTAVARPVLERLRDDTGETAALHLRQGWSRVVVAQVESRHEVRRTYPDIGAPLPLHRGAPSTAILAWLEPGELETYLAGVEVEEPDLDVAALARQFGGFREQGYTVSVAERTPGSASVAAPVLATSGRVVASVNISGPTDRLVDAGFGQLAPSVITASEAVSARLGDQIDAQQRRRDEAAVARAQDGQAVQR